MLAVSSASAQRLPVFLSDNHAECLGWVLRTVGPDQPHLLVLVDAHSDASAVERSEELREGMRRVASEEERAARVERWRREGRVQAFNWIEPLMPRPFDQVLWIAGETLEADERRARAGEARRQVDGRLEVEPRSAGTLGERWAAGDLDDLEVLRSGSRPVVLSLDLDFFAGMSEELAEAAFERIWTAAMAWPELRGVGVSVSRPWLADDAEADRLVAMLIAAVGRTRGAVLEIEAAVDDRPDGSRRAAVAGEEGPQRWDFERRSRRVKALIAGLGERCRVHRRGEAVESGPAAAVALVADGGEMDLDGVWRFDADAPPVLRLRGARGKVRWLRLEPVREVYDLLPETGLGKGFSESPGRWIYERALPLARTGDPALAASMWAAGPGRYRFTVEYEDGGDWLPGPVIELALGLGSGFRRALGECLGMPYVFGIAGVGAGDLSGVDTGWGADCGNLLVHAWRRQGIPMSWGDPGALRRQLREINRDALTAELLGQGVMIDFGAHVAALWEDREPRGVIGGEDLVMHQLGGVPEIVRLAALAAERGEWTAWTLPEVDEIRVRAAGDVVLAGEKLAVVEGFKRGGADLFVANLEGVPSTAEPDAPPRYDFRFPPEKIDSLRERGLDVVSMANNHAGDAGRAGLAEGVGALREAGLGVCGVGADAAAACEPWRTKVRGRGVAVFGVSLVDCLEAGEGWGAAALPAHRRELEAALREARRRGERIVVIVHGGDEYETAVNDSQRHWARWLVRHGAALVVGAHPHVVQRREHHGGATVLHSLGNAVYPETLTGADGGAVIEVPLR